MIPDLTNTPPIVQYGFNVLSRQPVISSLIALMFLDTVTGVFLAIAKKTLNSTTSWRGGCKKAIILLIIAASAIVQPLVPTIPIMNMIGTWYALTELISLLENAGAAGVPLPAGLLDTLQKLREQKIAQALQKGVTTVTNVTVMPSPTPPPGVTVSSIIAPVSPVDTKK